MGDKPDSMVSTSSAYPAVDRFQESFEGGLDPSNDFHLREQDGRRERGDIESAHVEPIEGLVVSLDFHERRVSQIPGDGSCRLVESSERICERFDGSWQTFEYGLSSADLLAARGLVHSGKDGVRACMITEREHSSRHFLDLMPPQMEEFGSARGLGLRRQLGPQLGQEVGDQSGLVSVDDRTKEERRRREAADAEPTSHDILGDGSVATEKPIQLVDPDHRRIVDQVRDEIASRR